MLIVHEGNTVNEILGGVWATAEVDMRVGAERPSDGESFTACRVITVLQRQSVADAFGVERAFDKLRIVELVAAQTQSSREEGIAGDGCDLSIAQRTAAWGHARGEGKNADHGISGRGEVVQRLAQIHEPATFGIDWTPCCSEPANVLTHSDICSQSRSMQLRIPAAHPQGVKAVRQMSVKERAEKHEFSAGAPQSLKVILVKKAKGGVTRDAKTNPRRRQPQVVLARNLRPGAGSVRCREQGGKINVFSTQAGKAVPKPSGPLKIAGGVQPQVSLGNGDLRFTREAAEHAGAAGSLNRAGQQTDVTNAADTIKNDAGNTELRLELFKAFDKGGDALPLTLGVDDEDDRSIEPDG